MKVLPNVETCATVKLHGLSDADAIKAMSAALGSPFEATGLAHFPKDAVTMIRVEGFADSVTYRADKLRDLLAPFGEVSIVTDDEADWHAVRDVRAFEGQEGDVWRFSVKPSDAPALVARMDATAVQYDWGGGLIWALTERGRDLRAAVGPFDGHATLIRGSADAPTFQPEAPALAAITTGLRAKFDPRGILNPGIMS